MSNVLVIYRSVTGFARQYAQWIAEDLDAEARDLLSVTAEDLARADLVIFGGGVHMGRIRDFTRFRTLLDAAGRGGRPHAAIVWANGGTPRHPDRDWKPAADTFTTTELARGDWDYFYLEGGVRWEGLKGADRVLLTIFSRRVQKHRHRGPWAEEVANNIVAGYDRSSRDQITPLVERARELLAQS